jgi:NAD(P)-dependent dehydrogenase (short-subunit alcohol dehydrogenase family)
MKQHFAEKTALVTGVGWGVGAAAALLYAANGMNVIVSDVGRREGNATVAAIKNRKGEATFIRADVNDPVVCEKLINRTIEKYGRIDIACNNTVIFSEGPPNLNGLFYCMKYEMEAMRKQGGGIIVNMNLMVGTASEAPVGPYIGAKYGMEREMQNVAVNDPASGIHIHVVSPAFIYAALRESRVPAGKEAPLNFDQAGSRGKIEELASLIIWLSSEKHLLPPAFTVDN